MTAELARRRQTFLERADAKDIPADALWHRDWLAKRLALVQDLWPYRDRMKEWTALLAPSLDIPKKQTKLAKWLLFYGFGDRKKFLGLFVENFGQHGVANLGTVWKTLRYISCMSITYVLHF